MNTSPCKKNGKDCPKRDVGCRNTCAAWAAYQILLVKEREEKKEAAEKTVRSKQVKSRHYTPARDGSRIKE